MSGSGFISDNLLYLAKEFGIEVPDINLTQDELCTRLMYTKPMC